VRPLASRPATEGGRCRELHRLDEIADADRVPDLERPELPGKSPLHRPIDIVNGMRDLGGDFCRVDERLAQRRPQEVAHLVGVRAEAF
jgi:hypothetical protein